MRWIFPSFDKQIAGVLERELGIPALVARLLALRELATPEAAQRFLHPRLQDLHDPFAMADMARAVARLRRTVAEREKVLIYGDYDVDGATAVVVLLTALRSLGAQVKAFIPHRLTDGYGMRAYVLEQAAADGCKVVLSVDTGIREHEVIGRGHQLGIDCIITDHHLPDDYLPPGACAVLNPHRADCGYPEKNLSGVGVAFKLAQALLGPGMTDPLTRSYLKIVAIGTIADVVPLLGENRLIARHGLNALQSPVHPGLRTLLEVCGLRGVPVNAGHVGFRIAPRLNAAGRMESARAVIELFNSTDTAKTREIAKSLDALNRERQQVEDQIVKQVAARIEESPEYRGRYSLVFAGAGWHRGVIGIVAQRIMSRFHRPTLILSSEDGRAHGSGRSIAGFHLLEALDHVSDLFDRYGGHAQAAGFSLSSSNIAALEERFESYTGSVLRPEDLEPNLRVDSEVGLDMLDNYLFESLLQLEPHGVGNPSPVFAARSVRLVAEPRVLKGEHLKLRVSQGRTEFDALGWGLADRASGLSRGDKIDLAFVVERNEYRGVSSLQLNVKDLAHSAGSLSGAK